MQHCKAVRIVAMPWVSGKRQLVVMIATWARLLIWQQVVSLVSAGGV